MCEKESWELHSHKKIEEQVLGDWEIKKFDMAIYDGKKRCEMQINDCLIRF